MRIGRVGVNVSEMKRPLLALAHAAPDREGRAEAIRERNPLGTAEPILLVEQKVGPAIVAAHARELMPGRRVGRDQPARERELERAPEERDAVTDALGTEAALARPACVTRLLLLERVDPVRDMDRPDRVELPVDERCRLDVERPAAPVGDDVAAAVELATVEELTPKR